ncbi:uncharacterized protein LOC132162224 [Corylus avellana]|uniref:uncharacterized protein LOC132162224 n=1 Tax=Corylus avellana TaxID=13451 RepID=UPI00286CC8EB|nr:uncharacterized protein LOC132162224 [Corylus avellana]
MKADWDIAVNLNGKRIGIGVIIRDSKGLVIAALSRTVDTCPAPVIAESMGALYASEFCCDLGVLDVILKGDSIQVVKAINKMGDQCSRYGQVIVDVQMVLSSLRRWEVVHAKCEANFAAHGLTKIAAQEFTKKI